MTLIWLLFGALVLNGLVLLFRLSRVPGGIRTFYGSACRGLADPKLADLRRELPDEIFRSYKTFHRVNIVIGLCFVLVVFAYVATAV